MSSDPPKETKRAEGKGDAYKSGFETCSNNNYPVQFQGFETCPSQRVERRAREGEPYSICGIKHCKRGAQTHAISDRVRACEWGCEKESENGELVFQGFKTRIARA